MFGTSVWREQLEEVSKCCCQRQDNDNFCHFNPNTAVVFGVCDFFAERTAFITSSCCTTTPAQGINTQIWLRVNDCCFLLAKPVGAIITLPLSFPYRGPLLW